MSRLIKKAGNKMQIIYAGQALPKLVTKTLFLAGPTPRDKDVKSWRTEAIKILEKNNYDGTVFIPEPENGQTYPEYDEQYDWECQMMDLADCILFWIPRDLETLPGFTTNCEFGKYFKSSRITFGHPKNAEKINYLDKMAESQQIKINYTLEDTIKNTIEFLGNGIARKDAECYIPQLIYSQKNFQDWYEAQKAVGNELRYANINYTFVMPKARKVFLWILAVHVWIKAEDRIKSNEFLLSRTDTCDVLLYYKQKNIEDTIVILTKEFRSPVNNSEEFIYELPGGSSMKEEDNIDVIHDEVAEELGIDLNKERFKYEESRQVIGTLSTHKSHLYSVKLDDDDLNIIKEAAKITHGVAEDTELTYIEIRTLKDIMSNNLLDWANMGKILSIINKNK